MNSRKSMRITAQPDCEHESLINEYTNTDSADISIRIKNVRNHPSEGTGVAILTRRSNETKLRMKI
jgi:hypothetical protein